MREIFNITKSEIPIGNIASISFPDMSIIERIQNYGRDSIPVTIEFTDGTRHIILCGKTLMEENKW